MKLAINGGPKVRETPFPAYITTGEEEQKDVQRVLERSVLSRFLGVWHEQFYGGDEVRRFEEAWAAFYNVKHAIAVNSNTSGLYCAVGAIGVEPGDEIIVPPYTMSASAVAPLVYNAIPVFADIEQDYFCISPKDIERVVTSRTRAIIAVDLFGQPYEMNELKKIAKKYDLKIIEDCAQAPVSRYKNIMAGSLGDIGVFSLNYHKHIQTGEGGVIVTNDDVLAEKIRLIRNHAESVVEKAGVKDLTNMIGFNYRMTEIEAAIGRIQLTKLDGFQVKRNENVSFLTNAIKNIPPVTTPAIREHCSHSFYVHACKWNEELAEGVTREAFVNAVAAELPHFDLREKEGVKISCGYVKPLYRLPIFQQMRAYGSGHFPFDLASKSKPWSYMPEDYPVVENLFEKELFVSEFILPSLSHLDMKDIENAFNKVWENRNEL